ncbi:MAG: hypothetical protein ACOH2H_16040 [Cypionkella sp.]
MPRSHLTADDAKDLKSLISTYVENPHLIEDLAKARRTVTAYDQLRPIYSEGASLDAWASLKAAHVMRLKQRNYQHPITGGDAA